MCCNTQVERIDFRKFPEQEKISSFIVENLGGNEEAREYEAVIKTIAADFSNKTIAIAKLRNHTIKALTQLSADKEGEDLVLRFFFKILVECLPKKYPQGMIARPTEGVIRQFLGGKIEAKSIHLGTSNDIKMLAKYLDDLTYKDDEQETDQRQNPRQRAYQVVTPFLKNVLVDLFLDLFDDVRNPCSTRISEIQPSRCVIL